MSTLTPNYGLIVPEATNTVAQVRADYATNLGIIDNISGGGGGGGGNVFGAFINTNDVIKAQTDFYSSMTYTATKDCFVGLYLVGQSNSSATIYIDSKKMYAIYYNAVYGEGSSVWLKEGQTLSITGTHSGIESYYIVYGLIQGTESIFTPIIYSDNERCIGIWRDNKPLYQRTFTITLSNTADWTLVDDSVSYDKLVLAVGSFYEVGGVDDQVGQASTRSSLPRICVKTDHKLYYYASDLSAGRTFKYDVTVQYTKTTDVAGSGNWNTDGIPMVHYTTSEQVIGTYLGQTLYQKTFVLPSTINVSYTSWSDMGVSVTNGDKVVGCFGIATDGTHSQLMAYFDSDVVKCQSARNGNPSYNVQEITIQYTKSS